MKVAIYHTKTNRKYVGNHLLLSSTCRHMADGKVIDGHLEPIYATRIMVPTHMLDDHTHDAFRSMYDTNGRLKPKCKYHNDGWYYAPIKRGKAK